MDLHDSYTRLAKRFLRAYVLHLVKFVEAYGQQGLDCEIRLGTLNTDDDDGFVGRIKIR
jgi:hypothetical protein